MYSAKPVTDTIVKCQTWLRHNCIVPNLWETQLYSAKHVPETQLYNAKTVTDITIYCQNCDRHNCIVIKDNQWKAALEMSPRTTAAVAVVVVVVVAVTYVPMTSRFWYMFKCDSEKEDEQLCSVVAAALVAASQSFTASGSYSSCCTA